MKVMLDTMGPLDHNDKGHLARSGEVAPPVVPQMVEFQGSSK